MQTTPDSKEEYIERLFASIASRYDLLNTILSFNRHKYWRKFAVKKCSLSSGGRVLDVAAGTLDFAIELSRPVGHDGSIFAIDFCRPMLEIGRRKLEKQGITNISLAEANAEHLPVKSGVFDAATIGFALRNVASIENTLAEMTRAVKIGGRVVSLEFAKPEGPVFRPICDFYLNRALPFIGGIINGRREPYSYLPASIARFLSRDELSGVMRDVGLTDIKVYNLTGGIVAVHVGIKK